MSYNTSFDPKSYSFNWDNPANKSKSISKSKAKQNKSNEMLIKNDNNIKFVVSYTTRQPRKGEIDGVDYRFISKSEFELMIEEPRFIEWAIVHNHYYGTPISEIEKAKSCKCDILLDIDIQGARTLKEKQIDGIYVFITPSSINLLEERLYQRMSEGLYDISKRLEDAKEEMKEAKNYDYIIINDSLEGAIRDLNSIILAERCKKGKTLKLLDNFFE